MGWYNSNWQFRKKITIDNTKVNADLTDFPIYVDLSDLGSDFFNNVKADGGDIRITKADGTTELAREVVNIDTSGLTGEVHFKADALGSTTDTEFYIYYGNAAASDYAVTDTYGRNNVWTDYDGVYHLQGNTTNSAGTTYSEQMDGTSSSSGKIYGAYDFDGSSDELITSYQGFSGTSTFGCSMWFNRGSGGSIQPMLAGVSSTLGSANENFYLMLANSKTNVQVAIKTGGSTSYTSTTTNTTTINAGTWYYSSVWYDGSNLYNKINNSAAASSTATGLLNTNTTDGLDFAHWKAHSSYWYDGLLDEIRFTTTPKNEHWYSTEYNNQNSASTFYSAGAQETGQINIVSISPAHESTGNAVDTNLVITYDQNVTAGTGSLTVTQRDGLIIGDGFAGKIGEMILTNENLSQDTIEKVEGYLAWKWFGINNPLPDSHPYKLRRPVI